MLLASVTVLWAVTARAQASDSYSAPSDSAASRGGAVGVGGTDLFRKKTIEREENRQMSETRAFGAAPAAAPAAAQSDVTDVARNSAGTRPLAEALAPTPEAPPRPAPRPAPPVEKRVAVTPPPAAVVPTPAAVVVKPAPVVVATPAPAPVSPPVATVAVAPAVVAPTVVAPTAVAPAAVAPAPAAPVPAPGPRKLVTTKLAPPITDSVTLARQEAQVTAEAKAWLATVGPRLDSVREGYSSNLDSLQRVTDTSVKDPRERAHIDSMFTIARWKNDSIAKTNNKKTKKGN
jgi:hypothetical protein